MVSKDALYKLLSKTSYIFGFANNDTFCHSCFMSDQTRDTFYEHTYQKLFKEHALQLRNSLKYKGAEGEQARDLMQKAFWSSLVPHF